MLVVTREVDEEIIVTTETGKRISIMVVDFTRVNGQRPRVKLGVDAPPEFTVHRREVQEQVDSENQR